MCRRVTCEKCGKPTFAGCGAHVEQVLAGVPVEQRCACRSQAKVSSGASASPADAGEKRAWWRFGN